MFYISLGVWKQQLADLNKNDKFKNNETVKKTNNHKFHKANIFFATFNLTNEKAFGCCDRKLNYFGYLKTKTLFLDNKKLLPN